MTLLQRGGKGELVLKAAGEVREAEIRAIKAKIEKLPASEKSAAQIGRWNADIDKLRHTPVETILEVYQHKVAGLKTPVRIRRAPRRGS